MVPMSPFLGTEHVYLLFIRDATKKVSIPDRLVLPYESWQVQFFDGSSKKSCILINCYETGSSLHVIVQQYDGWDL